MEWIIITLFIGVICLALALILSNKKEKQRACYVRGAPRQPFCDRNPSASNTNYDNNISIVNGTIGAVAGSLLIDEIINDDDNNYEDDNNFISNNEELSSKEETVVRYQEELFTGEDQSFEHINSFSDSSSDSYSYSSSDSY